MYILAPEGTFEETLKDSLTRLGAQVASNKADADVVLHITKAVTTREVGTLDERGKASSYNLILNVDYELKDPAGEEIRSAKLKEKVRYDYNPDLVIESESEERDLTEDLEQEVALRIVRQLSTVTDYPHATQQ